MKISSFYGPSIAGGFWLSARRRSDEPIRRTVSLSRAGETARLCRSENSVDKPSGVIRLRVQDDLVGQTALHDPAVMEHDDPVAKLLYQRDVVADEEIGQLPFLLQLLQEAR